MTTPEFLLALTGPVGILILGLIVYFEGRRHDAHHRQDKSL